MRMLVAFLIVVGVLYIWDVNYNHGVLTDGARSMLREIEHSFR
jgi:hypothetical protein